MPNEANVVICVEGAVPHVSSVTDGCEGCGLPSGSADSEGCNKPAVRSLLCPCGLIAGSCVRDMCVWVRDICVWVWVRHPLAETGARVLLLAASVGGRVRKTCWLLCGAAMVVCRADARGGGPSSGLALFGPVWNLWRRCEGTLLGQVSGDAQTVGLFLALGFLWRGRLSRTVGSASTIAASPHSALAPGPSW